VTTIKKHPLLQEVHGQEEEEERGLIKDLKSSTGTILDALQAVCHQRRNTPTVKKPNGKMGQGDLVLRNFGINGRRHAVCDTALIHEFGGSGNHMADVSRIGSFTTQILPSPPPPPPPPPPRGDRAHQGAPLPAYAARSGVACAFLPCVMSTAGRIHSEFLQLLYNLANRRSVRWFAQLGDDHPSDEGFKFRPRILLAHARSHFRDQSVPSVATPRVERALCRHVASRARPLSPCRFSQSNSTRALFLKVGRKPILQSSRIGFAARRLGR